MTMTSTTTYRLKKSLVSKVNAWLAWQTPHELILV